MGSGLSAVGNKSPEHSYVKHDVLKNKSDPNVHPEKMEKFQKDLNRMEQIRKLALSILPILVTEDFHIIFSVSLTPFIALPLAVATTGAAATTIALTAIPLAVAITAIAVGAVALYILWESLDRINQNYDKYRFINPYNADALLKNVSTDDESIQKNHLMHFPEFMRQNFITFRDDVKKLIAERTEKEMTLEKAMNPLQTTIDSEKAKINDLKNSNNKLKEKLSKELQFQLKIIVSNPSHKSKYSEENKPSKKLSTILDQIKQNKTLTLEDRDGKFILEDLDSTVKQTVQELMKEINKRSGEIEESAKKIQQLEEQIEANRATNKTTIEALSKEFNDKYEKMLSKYLENFEEEAYLVYIANTPLDANRLDRESFIKNLKLQINKFDSSKRPILLEKLIINPS